MHAFSFIKNGPRLVQVQLELLLVPGLPIIRFIGLPDTAMKESAIRIRAAIRSQGFKLPRGRQVLVHLRPNHLRKSSQGLDLAVAACLLWETGQIPPPQNSNVPVLYGELSLSGGVKAPDDLLDVEFTSCPDTAFYTGDTALHLRRSSLRLKQLRDLLVPVKPSPGIPIESAWVRPRPRIESLPANAADIAEVIAAGEHAAVFVGPPGTGKTTLAEAIPAWIEAPDFNSTAPGARGPQWRPVLRPHHSITPSAMIGGGSTLWAGEFSRADNGVLILDELLEFHRDIQEALREPLETGTIELARSGRRHSFNSRVLLLATCNLCPCGHFVPQPCEDRCRCTRLSRQRVLQKFSGPFADRFSILSYSHQWSMSQEPRRSSQQIEARVARATEFRRLERAQNFTNSLADASEIAAQLPSKILSALETDFGSQSMRRRDAVFRVARTLADLRQSLQISFQDLDHALHLALQGHQLLEQCRF